MAVLSQFVALLAARAGVGFILGIHEFGHFILCKLFDVQTRTFSIGFGPRILHKKVGETDFILSAIPMGAYVEIVREFEEEERPADVDKGRTLDSKPYYQKVAIMLGGIACNLLFAYVAMIGLVAAGLPSSPMLYPYNAQTTIATVAPDSAAQRAGLKEEDRIIAIDDFAPEGSAVKLFEILKPLGGKKVTVHVEREGQEIAIPVTLDSREFLGQKVGTLGVVLETEDAPGKGFIESIQEGIAITNAYIAGTAKLYLTMFRKRDMSNLGGPLMIISMTMKSVGEGGKIFLLLLVLLSIGLAILNLLPLPILDGGQVLFFTIEAIMGRPLPLRVREYIAIASWLLILGLMLYLAFWDSVRIAAPHIPGLRTLFGLG